MIKIYKFLNVFLLISVLLTVESKSMIEDEINEPLSLPHIRKNLFHHTKMYEKVIKIIFRRTDMPEEIAKKILCPFQIINVLQLRRTSKELKNIIDEEHWKFHEVNIIAKSSFPTIQDVKDIPFTSIVLSFEKWEQDDIKQLLYFKNVNNLHLEGLKSWDFSIGELFNPSPIAYCTSGLVSIANFAALNLLGTELYTTPIFENVTSLDLSNSEIGDYGVICFVSKFKKLKMLNISNNNIGKNIMDEAIALAKMKSLTSLNISQNDFDNQAIIFIYQLDNLTALDVSYNYISDHIIIKKFKTLPKLTNFIFNNQKNSNTGWAFPQ